MKKLVFMFMAVVAFVACDKEDDNPARIELSGGTSTSQIVYADETTKADGIKFTATADWTATVKEISSARAGNSNVDWLTLNMYSGGAGDYTLTMTLKENLTGKNRKAQVVIQCGNDIITIIVEQKGTKEDGEVPDGNGKQVVESIIYLWEDSKDDWRQQIMKFAYNSDGKIKNIITYDDSNRNGIVDADEVDWLDSKTEFTYISENQVRVVYTDHYDKQMETKTMDLRLNNDGYAISAKYVDEEYIENYTITYENGYAVSAVAIDAVDNSRYTETATWTNGNLTKVAATRGTWSEYSIANYGSVVNQENVNIDLNYVVSESEWYGCFCEDGNYLLKGVGLFGKRSKNMIESEMDTSDDEDNDVDCTFDYQLNTDGYIVKINSHRKQSYSGVTYDTTSTYTINYKK